MFFTKASRHTATLTILLNSMLVDRVFALPALADTINSRQETGGGYYIPPVSTTTYGLTSTTEVDGVSFNDAASGGAGISLSHSESYDVGYSITVGASLGLTIGDIFNLGTSASISKETSKSSTDTVAGLCPTATGGADQWTCSLSITPSMLQKSGTMTVSSPDSSPTVSQFVVQFPRVSTDNNLVFKAAICSCGNIDGWGSPGAPPKCPQDC